MLSFLNGDVLSVGGGSPPNIVLFGLTLGEITNPHPGSGAPLLTTTRSGAVLPEMTLAYETYGRLNAAKSNVVLLFSHLVPGGVVTSPPLSSICISGSLARSGRTVPGTLSKKQAIMGNGQERPGRTGATGLRARARPTGACGPSGGGWR